MGLDETVRRLAEIQQGVVGRRQLWAVGIGYHWIQHRVDTGMLIPISAQVLRMAGAPVTDAGLAMAGVLDSPGSAYLSHLSAAAWWGLPGFSLDSPVHTLIPRQGVERRTRLSIVHYHSSLPTDHLRQFNGVPITSPALTVFLLAGSVHAARTERALDNAWSMRLVTYRELHDLLHRLAARGRNGIRVMRRLLAERPEDYVPPQSGLEARVARLARDVGVLLQPQVDVGGTDWVGRVDFVVEDSDLLIEVLSRRYHGSVSDQRADGERFDRLERGGFKVLTLWDSDIWERAETVRDRILAFSRGDPGLQTRIPARERRGT
ncbi:MAG TPA: DUF559 domain-containing protein [Acidimicrobiia bacterium]|nr:DUF559 domain-containing protein [Acidimicrobiia bacterium]